MSRAKELQAIRGRYEDFTPEVPDQIQVFTRGEVGILLEEITHLTLLMADLHEKTRKRDSRKVGVVYRTINGVLHERRPDGHWQAVMGLE